MPVQPAPITGLMDLKQVACDADSFRPPSTWSRVPCAPFAAPAAKREYGSVMPRAGNATPRIHLRD